MAAKARWLRLNIDFDDSDWLGVLSAEAQLAWVKLLCHAKRDGAAGRVRNLSVPVAARKWGVKPKAVSEMLAAAAADGALGDENGEWLIVNWLTYQPSDETNAERQRKTREKRILDNAVIAGTDPGQEKDNAVMPTHNGGITPLSCRANSDSDIDKEITTPNGVERASADPPKRDHRMKPPAAAELAAYFQSQGSTGEDASRFWDYYQANGWKVGKNPMRDWEAAARGWIARDRTRGSPGSKPASAPPGKTADDYLKHMVPRGT